jgi:hypothetical protein
MNDKDDTTPAPGPDEIRQHLKKVLESPVFRGSKRCQRFLAYVAEAQLKGETEGLKERTIAVEVFDRDPNSDLNDDSIVRVGAREVRKRLAQYYVSPEAEEDAIHIDLPSGSYVPEFRWAQVARAGIEDDNPRPPAPPQAGMSALTGWKIVCGVLAVAVVGLALWIARLHIDPGGTVVEQFWRPALESKDPLLVALPHPALYRPSRRVVQESERHQPTGPTDYQQVTRIWPDVMTGKDFQLVQNQYIGLGDAVVASAVAGFLGAHGRGTRMRLANQVEFADLRETPVLLVGAFTNRWTMELVKGFRFRPEWEHQENAHIVETAPPYRSWRIASRTEDEWTDEDYVLICRVPHSQTGGTLFVAAGVTQSGTEAAATVLVRPKHLEAIFARLPHDWPSRNVEILLHTRVIGHTASPPEVVAWHVW